MAETHAEWDRPPTEPLLYNKTVSPLLLWSHIIYGHLTASISPKIVRFYGARTTSGRRQEESYDFFVNRLCYDHKSSTGTVLRLFHPKSYDSTAPGRRQEESYDILINFLDIVRCPVKYRYYLNFHGSRTAFGKVVECKMTPAGHRTKPGRRLAGVGSHRTDTGQFLFEMYIVRYRPADLLQRRSGTVRCPAGHRPMISYTDDGRRPYHIVT